MSYVFRDTDMLFSAEERGIWLHAEEKDSLLLLVDCIPADCHQGKESRKSVGTRDVTKLIFTFFSTPPVCIVFAKGILPYIRTGKTAAQRFHQLQNDINAIGYCTLDLS